MTTKYEVKAKHTKTGGGVPICHLMPKDWMDIGSVFKARVVAENGWAWTRRVEITSIDRPLNKRPVAFAKYDDAGPSKIDLANARSRKKFKEGKCQRCKKTCLVTNGGDTCQGCRNRVG